MQSFISRISRARLVDQAADVLREAILAGELQPGARLRQVELAERIGISRTPLQQALVKLAEEGLTETLPAGGWQVAGFDYGDAVEMYELREVIDGLAARLAAEKATPGECRQLAKLVDNMRRAAGRDQPHAWFLAHDAFHQRIMELSHNRRLLGQSPLVRMSIQRFHPFLLTTGDRLQQALDEHEHISNAVSNKLPEEAERQARLHIVKARLVLMHRRQEEDAWQVS